MTKDRLSALIVAVALLATLATPALAADSGATSPSGAFERVTAFVDSLVEQVQSAFCFGSCGSETVAAAKASQLAPDNATAVPADGGASGPPTGMVAGLDSLGYR